MIHRREKNKEILAARKTQHLKTPKDVWNLTVH